MSWFKRLKDGIQTATKAKKETPDGLWHKCDKCNELTTHKDLAQNYYCCPKCDHHVRIGSQKYFEIIFGEGNYERHFDEIISKDILGFVDLKGYGDRLKTIYKDSELSDAISVGAGEVDGYKLVVCCMDFTFIGGSMGSVVGEKISRSIDLCIEHRAPLMIISKSGGARMMESAFSLMQMAKVSAALGRLGQVRVPYISVLTDPTTGGVAASFAMQGDVIVAEPKALIGFAGPRVIEQTIRQKLPEGFQRSEFLLEHGMIDRIVPRADMRDELAMIIKNLGFN